MTGLHRGIVALAAILVLGSAGCAGNTSSPPSRMEAEVRPPRPHAGAVWVPGHWQWQGRREGYVWLPGHWKLP